MKNKRKTKTPATPAKKSSPSVFNVQLAEVRMPSINLTQLKYSVNPWVNYGDKNLWPEYLIKLITYSTVHQSFINKRSKLIYSEGLSYSDNISEFLENLNEEGGTADNLLEIVSTDLSVLETFAVVVRYNRMKDKIVAIDYLDSSKVRVDKNLDVLGNVQGYWISADWTNPTVNKPQYFEKFNPNNINETTQVYFYHKRATGNPFYPIISYASAIHFIEMAYEMGKFSLNDILNGFFGSALLSITANMTDEQKAEFMAKIKAGFTGSENASKLLTVISEEINSVTLTPLNPTDNTDKVASRKKVAVDEISTAHGGNPIVAGVTMDGSTLGSDGKLYRDALEIYYIDVIRHYQKPFISFIRRVLDFNGYSDYELEITSSALMTDTEVPAWKMDYLKPEVWIAEQGYSTEDILPELINGAGDVENPDEVTDDTPEIESETE
ncbi:phage portal protein [Pontibacter qinzhouensis]|uniref:Phage portal protein n=1 Tax=Pontibacter qinzhouensis TaxID=2603253 RepID=A0A5C8IQ35_9BACT|nr:phage portal protein [Pontibacter qinzhouensis]TXK23320.1 phage portal protein [Pontibacter qinzhouensis]